MSLLRYIGPVVLLVFPIAALICGYRKMRLESGVDLRGFLRNAMRMNMIQLTLYAFPPRLRWVALVGYLAIFVAYVSLWRLVGM